MIFLNFLHLHWQILITQSLDSQKKENIFLSNSLHYFFSLHTKKYYLKRNANPNIYKGAHFVQKYGFTLFHPLNWVLNSLSKYLMFYHKRKRKFFHCFVTSNAIITKLTSFLQFNYFYKITIIYPKCWGILIQWRLTNWTFCLCVEVWVRGFSKALSSILTPCSWNCSTKRAVFQ